MIIHDLLVAMGFYMKPITDSSDDFWSSPTGFLTPIIIFVFSCINIYHCALNYSFFNRLFYSCLAVIMLCAFLLNMNRVTDPHHITESVMYLFCARIVCETTRRLWIYYRKTSFVKTYK